MESDTVSLSCASCDAKLEITDDLDVFACFYCGNAQRFTSALLIKLNYRERSAVLSASSPRKSSCRKLLSHHQQQSPAWPQTLANQTFTGIMSTSGGNRPSRDSYYQYQCLIQK
jgi:hypothetical protein